MLLILSAVSLSAVFSEKGIFSRAEKAGNRYNEAKAREVLETVLLADGQYEKNTNSEYNQDEFLDDLITTQIQGSRVIEGTDIVVIEEKYAFELDRSIPKIGRYLGMAKDLVWPKVEITSEPTLINNGREAKFTAKATEEAKGITRIELWLNGKRIEKETITYETPQTEIIKEFTVNKNGKYTVKAYADLMGSTKTTVEGIVPAVSFLPNGSEEWKKEHTTQIIVEETAETITEMKYVWVKDNGENEPVDNLFTTDCLNNRTITGGNDTMTGQYYLWVMLKTGTGENARINKYSSNAFYFDNEGPTITLESTPKSEKSFALTATANDNNKSGIARYEFYVDGKLEDTQPTTLGTATYIWNGTEMVENKECYVIVYDGLENPSEIASTGARTKLYSWDVQKVIKEAYYSEEAGSESLVRWSSIIRSAFVSKTKPKLNTKTGVWEGDSISIDKDGDFPPVVYNYIDWFIWDTRYENVWIIRNYESRAWPFGPVFKRIYHEAVYDEEITYVYSTNKGQYGNDEIINGKRYLYKGLR